MAKINIYQYGNLYKIVWDKVGGISSKNDDDIYIIDDAEKVIKDSKIVNSEKLENNVSRAKNKILEYALCNEWQYFFTLTIDRKKQDRYNLDSYIRALGDWISNYNKKYGTNLKYVLVPEWHPKNGGWHCHGLFANVNPDSLVINEFGYWDMPYYKNRFGFISISPIKNAEKVAFYITKYVQKDINTRNTEMNKHLYYASNGLSKKINVLSCNINIEKKYLDCMWQNDYCGIEWVDSIPDFILDAYNKDFEK